MSVYMTAGMSEHRIGPADSSPAEYAERVELMAICEVPVAGGLNGQEDVPTQVLQDIGDFILSQKIIVEVGHTLDFQSPLASNTAMTAFLFATPPDGIDAKRIRKCSKAQEILNLVPITSAELEFTRREGVMALLDKFEASGTEPVFDVFRKSAV